MANYLFQFTIGPVQSFIAQARKLQDLYAGSELLSALCRKAIDEAKRQGMEIIFPQLDKHTRSIPNRFVASISCEEKELAGKGSAIEKVVREEFKNIAERAIGKIRPPEGFKEQIENHLEIFWLFVPEEDNYYAAYQELERQLGGLKNIRAFRQYPETGRKCSIDGERNALFFGPDTNSELIIANRGVPVLADDVWINPNEGLSAVSFVKRNYRKSASNFESTAGIAVMDYVKHLEAKAYDEYKELFRAGNQLLFDEQLCYEENLTERYFKKQGLSSLTRKLEEIKKQYKKIFTKGEPPKYYAVLAFDGDNMGKVVGGGFLKEEFQKTHLKEFQKEVSRLLGAYAEHAKNLLNEKSEFGRVVYAGGDDFLGFVNLKHLFTVLQSLRCTFEDKVNRQLKVKFGTKLKEDFNFTFSAGLVIAHYKMPLHFVLQRVREMEKRAKDDGRNRLAIAVLKHSGESHEAIIPWDLATDTENKLFCKNVANLEKIIFYLTPKEKKKQAAFSDTFIRNAERELYLLTNQDGTLYEGGRNNQMLISLAKAEIKRLLKRSVNPALPNKDEICDDMYQLLTDFLPETENENRLREVSIDNFMELMKVALFIKRKTISHEHSI